ncbi:putative serine/threonine-protein kinase SIS8 isoform X2 [Silene latifolia]|uniref:putative serine/threonine-protein kinase SIS8 isoform X2 n=1 Tax=Silene latifolia TaxID=37657 RepID=UPI003D788CD0
MKNLLKKLNVVPPQKAEGSSSSKKPLNGLAGWFNSVTNRRKSLSRNPDYLSNKDKDSQSSCGEMGMGTEEHSSNSNSKDADVEEEYQIQLALELSAREDPEAVQIEAVKQISLASSTSNHTPQPPAYLLAYRYWNYNVLSYDDKILDGFYDLYGVGFAWESSKMPSLVDLQGTPFSEEIKWEAVLVNSAADANLLELEQKVLILAAKARSDPLPTGGVGLVQQLAIIVSDYMGGPVVEPDNILKAWRSLSYSLKSTLRSMVLPLGSLTIGLARHRALLFKVLADIVDVPCRLVKGQSYTGFDDVAMNFVKIDDGREFIVDLMADPGTLIPADASATHIDYPDSLSSSGPLSRDVESVMGTSSSNAVSSLDEPSGSRTKLPVGQDASTDSIVVTANLNLLQPEMREKKSDLSSEVEKLLAEEAPSRASYPNFHARSPSWTEGVSSPAARKMKVKDVSQYMIDAAKENPQLAQKLHDVLLESGVVAPPNLFSEVYEEHEDVSVTFAKPRSKIRKENMNKQESRRPKDPDNPIQPKCLPPLPHPAGSTRPTTGLALNNLQPDQGSQINNLMDSDEGGDPSIFGKNVPVSAAAAAAVIASSMVAAVAKFELPIAAAATATAAAVVATTAAVGKLEGFPHSPDKDSGFHEMSGSRSGEGDDACQEPLGSDKERDAYRSNQERTSDRSAGGDSAGSTRSDVSFDDVADCEISWEEITLGSYGEVYRGEWHGTEVAVKRFLDQDIYEESLEEFKSEVRIMKRLRHPNVVLFMGAITRPPNLSIVTEFLHRGSLYRLIHRPNNQLDERRRLRMAFDAARGMNYLHTCSPVVVHRDLKSPNLLVDKNWVVKVCDFGLSRMKHSTFLSSRSTAGTAEWMAPEVLRNEPSNEKCDVFSYGVILWELCTLQQPWGGMNPMQVVGAVGFQHRRLDIPDTIDPAVADIIQKCWKTDPKLRPSFAEIMASLKPLLKPITGPQLPKPSPSRGGAHDR